MTAKTILKKLEALGDEKRRKQNAERGAGENQFGVAMGELRKLAKAIKTDHALALDLWASGNEEARMLATLILEPKKLSKAELGKMVKEARYSWLADWLNAYVVKKHPDKEALRQKWMTVKDPMQARAAWSLTQERVEKDAEGIQIGELLDRIEAEMADAKPAAQWTMNFCLTAIGIHHPKHRKRAIAIGEKLGVYRDYPVSKGCVSPFAPIAIEELVRRQG